MQITGAELFVQALRAEGVNTLFAYPGGQAIDLFDALYDAPNLQIVLPRHEQGLVHAADGYARATGKPGVCLVTSGPGAANLVTGIATANYDSVPLVCFTGQVPTSLLGSGAFQEVDIVGMVRSITKYAVTVRRREDLAAAIQTAFRTARSGRPGAVLVDLPKDIQQARGSGAYRPAAALPAPPPPAGALVQALDWLKAARRPLFLFGGGVHCAHASRAAALLAERTGVPVVTTILGRGALPTRHPLYVGNLGIHGSYAANTAVSACDLLFAVGARFNDRVTGSGAFAPHARIVRIDIAPAAASGRAANLSITADAREALLALLRAAPVCSLDGWRAQIKGWEAAHPLAAPQETCPGVTPLRILRTLGQVFPDAIFTTDVGQNQLWATQFLELPGGRPLLTSGGLGTMGYGFPAALGAKLGCPERDVVAICGDGGFQMTFQELAAAVACELPVTICLLNNGWLGNVRQWQELFFDRRYSGTCLRRRKSCPTVCSAPSAACPAYTPDFVRLAESYGAKALRICRAAEIRPALEQAKRTPRVPTLIEFQIEPEENVLPIVPPGRPLAALSLDGRT